MNKYKATIAFEGCSEPGCCTTFLQKQISASSLEEAEALADETASNMGGSVCEIEEIL